MSFLQYASRHVHHTVADYLQTQMGVLNWTGDIQPTDVPFGAPILQFQRSPAIVGDPTLAKIQPGTVAITLGNEPPTDPQELGGPLTRQDYPMFIDIFMQYDGEAIAVACDIRDILMGRLPGTHRFLPVVNQISHTTVPGWIIELDDIERVRPDTPLPLAWHSVHVTASTYFQEVQA